MIIRVTNRDFHFYTILFVVLGYYQFIKFTLVPRPARILSEFAAIIVIILFLLIKQAYYSEKEAPKNFIFPISLFIISMFLSTIVTNFYHNQSYLLSIWISRGIFFYFLYFLLHAYKFEKKQLEKIIINIGLITIGLYYIQTILYPMQLFDVRMTIDRGTLRLFIPSMGFTIIAYFYYLNKFFKNNKPVDIIIALLCYSIFILQATRQLIASLALLTIINLFRSKQVKSRFFLVIFILIGMVAMFFIFFELFMEMFSVSHEQTGGETESPRIKAIRYFLSEFFPSDLAYILGNGEGHQASPYGMKLLGLQLLRGYYLSDIGLIGDYVRYGAVFVLAAFIMLFKLIAIKIDPEYEYLRYYVFLQLFTIVTGKGIFGVPDLVIILIAYMFDLGNCEYIRGKKKINSP